MESLLLLLSNKKSGGKNDCMKTLNTLNREKRLYKVLKQLS